MALGRPVVAQRSLPNPNKALFGGKSLKTATHLHGLLPPKWVVSWSLLEVLQETSNWCFNHGPFLKGHFWIFWSKIGAQWTAVVNLLDDYHAGRFARTKLSVYWVECSYIIKYYIHLKVVTLLAKKLKGIENGKLQTWCGWKSQRQMFGTVQYLVKSKSKVPLRRLQ